MQVRHPDLDFTDVSPVWASNATLVHTVNAQGIVPAYIEPFLIKVMRRAKAELDPVEHADLLGDMDIFNKQEAQHFKFHAALNTWVREHGYEGMVAYERSYEAEYDKMFRTRSLKWLLAYCEGFEAMGLSSATRWVDGELESQLPDADPRPIALWKWHLAEEYEHRTVAFRVLKALYGKHPVSFYFLRVSGFFHAARHIRRNVAGLQKYLLTTYRRREGIPEPEARRWSGSELTQVKEIASILSPAYDPARVKPPRRLDEVLAAT